MKRRRIKRNQGSVAALAFVALVPLVGCIGGFAVDCMHVNDEKGALQRATDAAALGGGLSLWSYKSGRTNSNSVYNPSNQNAVNDALTLASMNAVDGDGLFESPPGRTIVANVQRKDGAPLTTATPPDQCKVVGTCVVRSLLFSLMHNNFGGQTTTTTSIAGAGPIIDTLLTYFPFLVSKTQQDSFAHESLDSAIAADHDFYFNTRKANGGVPGNAVWTMGGPGYGDSDFRNMATAMLNGSTPPPEDSITSGNNVFGKHGTMNNLADLVSTDMMSHVGETIVFPVTDDASLNTGADNSIHVVGFVALRIVSASFNTEDTPHSITVVGHVVGKYIGNGISRGTGSLTAPYNQLQTISLVQ